MWKVSRRHLAQFPLLVLLHKQPHMGYVPVEVVGSELCGTLVLFMSRLTLEFRGHEFNSICDTNTLVDDLLQRLGPSLACHRSCDIIDINPGAGVWSAKVHDM